MKALDTPDTRLFTVHSDSLDETDSGRFTCRFEPDEGEECTEMDRLLQHDQVGNTISYIPCC